MATDTITGKALEADVHNAVPTEKVDGTCCYVTPYKGNKDNPFADFSWWLELVLLSFHFLLWFIYSFCEFKCH